MPISIVSHRSIWVPSVVAKDVVTANLAAAMRKCHEIAKIHAEACRKDPVTKWFPQINNLLFNLQYIYVRSHEIWSQNTCIESALSGSERTVISSIIYHHGLDKRDVDAEAICVN